MNRLGYNHNTTPKSLNGSKYWTNTILPLIESGHLESSIKNSYCYPNRIGLYPGLSCQFFCNFCGRNYDSSYSKSYSKKGYGVFQKLIDEDPREGNWQDRFRISGGLEPLTNPYIGDIVEYGSKNEFKMQMYTNGYALTEKFLDKQKGLLDLEVLRFSLYGFDSNSYTEVTKIEKSFHKVKNNIRQFLKNNDNTKVGVNWIILPGKGSELPKVFDLIEDINSTQDQKIQFITLREDFSQNASYLGHIERTELVNIFAKIEERCKKSPHLKDLHIDYGYQLEPIRQGSPAGPLYMANYKQMNRYGFPQIATTVDSKGNMYVYHESGFLDRPGSERYIIGNVLEHCVEKVVKKHLSGKGVTPKPFDVGFLDAFDHLITIVLDQCNNNPNWYKDLESRWK